MWNRLNKPFKLVRIICISILHNNYEIRNLPVEGQVTCVWKSLFFSNELFFHKISFCVISPVNGLQKLLFIFSLINEVYSFYAIKTNPASSVIRKLPPENLQIVRFDNLDLFCNGSLSWIPIYGWIELSLNISFKHVHGVKLWVFVFKFVVQKIKNA